MLHPFIKVGISRIEGRGLITAAPIKKGMVVWKGPTEEPSFTSAEIALWSHQNQAQFFFYAYQTGEGIWTGPKNGTPTDESLYMNHSCNPNTWFVGDYLLVARRDIMPGEELTYDYETSEVRSLQESPLRCHCGTEHCRGVLTGTAYMTRSFRRKYHDHVLSHVREMMENNHAALPA